MLVDGTFRSVKRGRVDAKETIETFFPKNFFSWTNTINFKKSGKI